MLNLIKARGRPRRQKEFKMKSLQKLLYHSAAYTVAISMIFFVFAAAVGISELSLTFKKYIVIFLFGLMCSAAEFLFSLKKVPRPIQYLIHYVALAISYFVIFLTVRNSDGKYEFSPASVFAALIIFSCFYALIMGAIVISKRQSSKSSKARKQKDEKGEKEKYKSRFS